MLEETAANVILAEAAARIHELKKNPRGSVTAGEGCHFAMLSRNGPSRYSVPARVYGALMERLNDIELTAIADA